MSRTYRNLKDIPLNKRDRVRNTKRNRTQEKTIDPRIALDITEYYKLILQANGELDG